MTIHERWKRWKDFVIISMENSTSVFNEIQYSMYKMKVERVCKIELNTICMYDKVCRTKSSTQNVQLTRHGVFRWKLNWNSTRVFNGTQHAVCSTQLNTAWRMETQHRLYKMKCSTLTLHTFTLYTFATFYTLHFSTLHFSTRSTLDTFRCVLHCTLLHFHHILHFTPLLHCTLFREWKG